MKWTVDLTAFRKSLERFPLTREEVGSKHQQFEKEITLDQYAKLLPIGEKLAPVVEQIRNVEVYKPEVIESVLTPMERTQFYDAISQLDQALSQVSFDTLRSRQNPDGDIRNALGKSSGPTPTVDHWARTLQQRVTTQTQSRQQPASMIDTTEAKAVIENLKKETEMAVEAHAKRVQMELADDQIAEITDCIKRHTEMSYWCLVFLIVTVLFAARLVVWISADGDKLGFCFGPVFHAITAETSSGAAFYFGVGKLAVISFAFGLVISVGRLYQTYCHKLVMNEQRMIAFRAFRKMLASVPDAGPREKLVTAAASAIFEHGSTGFLPKGTNEFTPLIGPLMEAAKAPKK